MSSTPNNLVTSNAAVSRADLLRALILAGGDSLNAIAEMTGFQGPVKTKLELKIPDRAMDLPPGTATSEPDTEPPASVTAEKPIYYYRVIDIKASDILPPPKPGGPRLPDWYYDIPDLDLAAVKPAEIKPPEKLPIVPWCKLWPALQALLSELKRAKNPDIPKLAKMLANAEIPAKIPRLSKHGWTAQVQFLVDSPERTCLFNEDYNKLLEQLQRLRGNTGLQIQQILQSPGHAVRVRQHRLYRQQAWRLPEAGSAIVILSDLGVLDGSGLATREWLQFGKRLRLAGFKPIVILPLPQRYLNRELIVQFDCVCWTSQGDLQTVHWAAAKQSDAPAALQHDIDTKAAEVLAWLSPAVRVEPALLRAVCRQLNVNPRDTGLEAAVWLHDDVRPINIGLFFKPESLEGHRRRFKQLAEKNPRLANHIVAILRRYHAHVFPTQLHEEMLIIAELMGNRLSSDYGDQIDAAVLHCRQLLKAMNEKAAGGGNLPAFAWHYCKRQHRAMFDKPQDERFLHLPALQGVLYREYVKDINALTANHNPTPAQLSAMLAFAGEQTVSERYVLCQRGQNSLQIYPERESLNGENGFSVGYRLGTFDLQSGVIVLHRQNENAYVHPEVMRLEDGFLAIDFPESKQMQLHINGAVITVERFEKPEWAIAAGCYHDESNEYYDKLMIATQSSNNNIFDWLWNPPVWSYKFLEEGEKPERTWTAFPGFWHNQLTITGFNLKPAWADQAGRDQYGLYADAKIAGVTQRFRWIQPGSFEMGSPKQEKGRWDNEVQHRVILSQGYWLADTVCTQALWQAVMGKNPSRFKGENRPLDNVDWDDVREFLEKLNRQQPDLQLRLPTEAEWEYACRAGTTGAFNFGDELTLEQVNYRDTWDDWNKWGDGTPKQTAEVKTYPANAWGLYEMHGNVWEWCQDWYGVYAAGPVTDPQGPETGDFRVLRGGSWIDYGGYCRSASRHGHAPGHAIANFGFRLARGHEAGQSGTGADRQPDGMRAAAARAAQPGAGSPDKAGKPGARNKKSLIDNLIDRFRK